MDVDKWSAEGMIASWLLVLLRRVDIDIGGLMTLTFGDLMRVDIDIGGFDDTDIGGFDAVIMMRGRGYNLPWMLTNGQLKLSFVLPGNYQ
eukprot:scaffold51237_cov41-Cyclotella_meneghiniana.AAC.2